MKEGMPGWSLSGSGPSSTPAWRRSWRVPGSTGPRGGTSRWTWRSTPPWCWRCTTGWWPTPPLPRTARRGRSTRCGCPSSGRGPCSPGRGPGGNLEYLLHLKKEEAPSAELRGLSERDAEERLREALESGGGLSRQPGWESLIGETVAASHAQL